MMLTQMLLPLLKKPRGQIVFINSSVGLTARPNIGHFSATQHAFKALADSLRERGQCRWNSRLERLPWTHDDASHPSLVRQGRASLSAGAPASARRHCERRPQRHHASLDRRGDEYQHSANAEILLSITGPIRPCSRQHRKGRPISPAVPAWASTRQPRPMLRIGYRLIPVVAQRDGNRRVRNVLWPDRQMCLGHRRPGSATAWSTTPGHARRFATRSARRECLPDYESCRFGTYQDLGVTGHVS